MAQSVFCCTRLSPHATEVPAEHHRGLRRAESVDGSCPRSVASAPGGAKISPPLFRPSVRSDRRDWFARLFIASPPESAVYRPRIYHSDQCTPGTAGSRHCTRQRRYQRRWRPGGLPFVTRAARSKTRLGIVATVSYAHVADPQTSCPHARHSTNSAVAARAMAHTHRDPLPDRARRPDASTVELGCAADQAEGGSSLVNSC